MSAFRPNEAIERDLSDDVMGWRDDKNIREIIGQVMACGAKIVDGFACCPKLGDRDKLALHEAACGIFGEAKPFFHDDAQLS